MHDYDFWEEPAPLGYAILVHFPGIDPNRADWFWSEMDRVSPQLLHLSSQESSKRNFFCLEMARLVCSVLLPNIPDGGEPSILDAANEIFEQAHLVLIPGFTLKKIRSEFFRLARSATSEDALAAFMLECWLCDSETSPVTASPATAEV